MEDETAGSHREPMDCREGEKIFLVNLSGFLFGEVGVREGWGSNQNLEHARQVLYY